MDYSSTFNYRIGSTTNILGRPPVFYRSGELLQTGQSFGSIYAVRAEDAQFIQEAGSAAGFKGTVWSQRLWLDFDSNEPAEQAKTYLKEQGYDHVVYTTGGRGCHIGVLRSSPPSHLLPLQDKLWAATNTPGCDLSLYWHLHLIRLPGAMHERTGFPKRLLYRIEGRELTLSPYEPTAPVQQAEKYLGSMERRQSIFQVWEVMRQLGSREPTGGRQRGLVSLARALRTVQGLTVDEALWVMLETNKGYPEPKSDYEVERIARWAFE